MIRLGSPPRVRGKVYFLQQGDFTIRITPAYAGKRRSAPAPTSKARDHPRVCGEKRTSPLRVLRTLGSPPRVRGKVQLIQPLVLCIGITPAYAGKSGVPCCSTRLSWDHPRVCGEKKPAPSGLDSQQGSPPRVRGKVPVTVFLCFCAGITPACAGKSSSCRDAL